MRLFIVVGFTFALYGGCLPAHAAESTECNLRGKASQVSVQKLSDTPLPERVGPPIRTSGRVPHVQVGVEPEVALTKELFRLAFTLPGLEKRPTIVSLPGGIGMWLIEGVPVVHPKTIIRGREFAHIHADGSLHAPLPFKRALELEKKGWGERHPWADRNEGWEGLVMLYSASTTDELITLVQLIAESYNYVTGRSISTLSC